MVLATPDTLTKVGATPTEVVAKKVEQPKIVKSEHTLSNDLDVLAALIKALETTLPTLPVRSRQG